jgi:hypothetical protein
MAEKNVANKAVVRTKKPANATAADDAHHPSFFDE